jgi:hypothetical protein
VQVKPGPDLSRLSIEELEQLRALTLKATPGALEAAEEPEPIDVAAVEAPQG